ncbi:ABC transporter integral membrane type-2 domain protein [Acididesulfobacillus acetoxydans]|uniref:Transport permease protein n=1 Tax=Acididesulfobacillus acetoxydans TaxID=1561005 RepID=A0A8S0VYN2_9FIRM|nr:ABC transporter permease [Acididesulfobacillus acetoxydans]CAA7603223.1 ABC transporter integral membrane type-2 domain protein [Acididesulfobacillus acetoxydans]
MGLAAIMWQEYVYFKRKFWSITLGSMISPVLYLIAFGWGLGGGMHGGGGDYINFIIPGIVGLTTMTASFSAIGNSINISRLYEKTFEEFMVAPLNMWVYAIGKVVAGAFRGLYSGWLIILLALVFRTKIDIHPYFVLMMVLNCLTFSAIGFTVGILIKSHADMAKFSNFIITPMAFLCGTFFPLAKMPFLLKNLIWLLPLTQTSLGLRSRGENIWNRTMHPLILVLYFGLVLVLGVHYCKKAE